MTAESAARPQPLTGIKVVAFTQFLAGPACAQYLADMGASVVKIEHPDGAFERRWSGAEVFPSGTGGLFLLGNRGCRSVAIDLKHPEGLRIARRFLTAADVLIENFRPGVMERLGLGYDAVHDLNPALVYASISGFGPTQVGVPGQDLLIQARSGMMAITGRQGDPPVPAGAPVVDVHTASLTAVGILGALFQRQRTGRGQHVGVSMVEAGMDLQMEPLFYHMNGGALERPRSPVGSSFHDAPYGVYQTRDGYIALSIVPLDALERVLQLPPGTLSPAGERPSFAQRDDIALRLVGELVRYDTQDLLDRFSRQDIWAAAVNDYEAALADQAIGDAIQLIELTPLASGGQPTRAIGHPIRYDGAHPDVAVTPPRLGEHTAQLLGELGLSRQEIDKLRDDGVIRMASETDGDSRGRRKGASWERR
ncbi:CaiB/BaiF CoA-transferase family protein [Acrocarpospora macrocephala]|uniref:CoA transferase n=1 Tax=Acrocarpospora macrocephala TaxID=150177 RepID=A0A5M3WTY0_9ACTN|nr:CaiB/BaiF CoA-transferase family protein [Acrocarpospora macrocephala]GES12354.1 CoA transferase [Acrocarpospora macrocephala]